ncbi:NAD(P)-dependent dehydrogenase, short-chain alcohol dehydrogenase family [Cellulomonas marina]|uniref:NAD(P)-dependent dehydrogenase, short-chain alcohol dehydrogenase family n=2 Tax=Cellulomonas marina TaxID=988821 RepID=A0A1I0WRZ5_9CELL|nr:NAD(P)-dependent dehydrogenase, short-chain alcohol dehydrogenase family [Cellulomonas marina]
MAVRSPEEGAAVRDRLARRAPRDALELAPLDVADLDSVRRLAAALAGRRIDVLVNNAGVGNIDRSTTPQGYETQLATNHLGPALLARLLHDGLAASPDPRVVTTGSNMYRHVPVRLGPEDLDGRRRYSRGGTYARTKTLHMVWAVEHGRRLEAVGSPVRSVVAHPGMVRTPMNTRLERRRDRALGAVLARLWQAREPEEGVVPLLWAATSPDVDPSRFAGPGTTADGTAVRSDPFRAPVTDRSLASWVWDRTEQLVA